MLERTGSRTKRCAALRLARSLGTLASCGLAALGLHGKRGAPLLLAAMLLLPGLAHAAEPGDISDKIGQGKKGTVAVRDSEEELYGYPLVGSDHTALYYLDTESCGYGIDGGRATLECIVYGVGRGKESAYMLTYIFETYKKDGKRKIFLRKVVAETGHDLTQNRLKWDNGFARHLFWQAAEACGLQEDLD